MPKRLAITGHYQGSILEYADGPLGEDEILVRTEMASGKHGTMFSMFDPRTFEDKRFDPERHIIVDDERDASVRLPSPQHPWPTGTSGLGVVEAVGANVSRFAVGDRVVGLMDIRETNVVDQSKAWRLGDLEPLIALCMEPAYVAFHCVRESNLRYGDTVAVIGLGALGLLAVSIAREAGAAKIIVADLQPSRLALAKSFGADHALEAGMEGLPELVRELSDGRGVDIAIELTGAYAGLNTAIRCTRVGGLVCSAGFYQGEAQGLFLGREYHLNRLSMLVPHGCGWGHEPRDYPFWDEDRAYRTILDMMGQDRLSAQGIINRVYTLDESVNVFQDITQRPDEIIKFAVDFRA